MPVLLQNRQRAVAVNCAWLGGTAEAVLAAVRAEAAELSLVLVSDRRMRSLNRRYRKKDQTTDVLAFPLFERRSRPVAREATGTPTSRLRKPQALPGDASDGQPMLLGDVVISMPTAKRQASEFGHSLRDEITRLLVHGVLHLLGYDHERSERDALLMTRKEKAVLRAIRVKGN
ncbi:MAG: rRNA maturation RNase YbeY [Nitrospirota bacterium]